MREDDFLVSLFVAGTIEEENARGVLSIPPIHRTGNIGYKGVLSFHHTFKLLLLERAIVHVFLPWHAYHTIRAYFTRDTNPGVWSIVKEIPKTTVSGLVTIPA